MVEKTAENIGSPNYLLMFRRNLRRWWCFFDF